MARRGTWLLLLLALFAAQLGIIRPAAATQRGDHGASTARLHAGAPAVQARRDPQSTSRLTAQQIDPPDALNGATRCSLPRVFGFEVAAPDDLVGTSSTRHRGGCASPRGPPSFDC